MEGFVLLSALSLAMFIGSYIAGSLPIMVSFSESKLRLVTVLGAGLLVGTALAVIIPEGVQSIYTAQSEAIKQHSTHRAHEHHHHQHPLERVKELQQPLETKRNVQETGAVDNPSSDKQNAAGKLPPPLVVNVPKRRKREVASEEMVLHEKQTKEMDAEHGGHSHPESDVHSVVGIALVAGFVLMLLVDQLAQSRLKSSDVETGGSVQPRYKITATIGLVVHAAADGVALGAASGSTHADVQFIVFLAIMLHKAPASFGLVTFLLHEGLDKSRIRKHLLIFALAAPVAAVATFIFITQGGHESLTSLNTTGVLLLFSAGTFLYVATVHVLPEVAGAGGHSHGGVSSGVAQTGGFKLNELIALVIGAIMPTLLTVGHSH